MRPLLVLVATAVLASYASAAAPVYDDDAALRSIFFVDRDEGWAVGDEGVIWHSIDGGRHWERQASGVRASLRSVQFLNPYTGWIVGRAEIPKANGSVGIVLFTQDGGLHWRLLAPGKLPGLSQVRFLDAKRGVAVGDGTAVGPSGVFVTQDSGQTWKAVAATQPASCRALALRDPDNAIVAGAWGKLMVLHDGGVTAADAEIIDGRHVLGVCVAGERAIAVGQGGLVFTADAGGQHWGPADIRLPTDVRSCWDLNAVCSVGSQVWAVGRPGSAVLHSEDAGQSWETKRTPLPLPLHGVFFLDGRQGWAAGELGSVIGTTDGGRTWSVFRVGSQRAAVLFVHARAASLPLETVASVGGEEGYVTAAIRATACDPASAAPDRASETERLATAIRHAGGAAGEVLWQFPLPQHLGRSSRADLIKSWNRLHADRAGEELQRQMALALRIWRPDVVITDVPDDKAASCPADAVVAGALQQAFHLAGDASAFAGQKETLGLDPWKASKLYAETPERQGAAVIMDGGAVGARLGCSARECAEEAEAFLFESSIVLPAQRCYRLLDADIDGAARQKQLMDGTMLAPGGTARRRQDVSPNPIEARSAQTRRNLEAIALAPLSGGGDASRLLGQVGPILAGMPAERAAATTLAIAEQYVRQGQWTFAREVFLLTAAKYPATPQAASACRWLIRHNSSSEARRREQLGQFVAATAFGVDTLADAQTKIPGLVARSDTTVRGAIQQVGARVTDELCDWSEIRRWNRGCVELGKRLETLGSAFADDPTIQFPIQAARRQLGEFDAARDWYTHFKSVAAEGPWRDAAAAEVWLLNRTGPPPKPVAWCRQFSTPPYLDGKLDDPCWQGSKPLTLTDAVGQTAHDYATEAWFGYDQDYLYVALRCRHPAGKQVAPIKPRPHDADLRPFDRVSLLFDLDRDYATYFRFEVDQRGCVCEDCWGDRTWNPRWFVANQSEPTCWQAEAAIPLRELTGDPVSVGKAWACNVVRILPSRGVQAWSTPADVQPRPEGMGLVLFTKEPPRQPVGK